MRIRCVDRRPTRWPVTLLATNGFRLDCVSIRISMTENDVYCAIEAPDHVKSDALGGDQLVYQDQRMYIYISPRTDRVIDVHPSY